MTTAKHTPGPWRVGMRSGHNCNTIYAQLSNDDQYSDPAIAQIYGIPLHTKASNLSELFSIGLANARLIAAAPELLAALRRFLEYGNVFSYSQIDPRGSPYEQARAAIAKAVG